MNYSVDGSIGTQSARVLFGEIAFSDIAMDLPSESANRDSLEFLSKLREAHSTDSSPTILNWVESNKLSMSATNNALLEEPLIVAGPNATIIIKKNSVCMTQPTHQATSLTTIG